MKQRKCNNNYWYVILDSKTWFCIFKSCFPTRNVTPTLLISAFNSISCYPVHYNLFPVPLLFIDRILTSNNPKLPQWTLSFILVFLLGLFIARLFSADHFAVVTLMRLPHCPAVYKFKDIIGLWIAKVSLATEIYPGLYEEGKGEISMSFALSFQ